MTDAARWAGAVARWCIVSAILAIAAGVLQAFASEPWPLRWIAGYVVATGLPYIAALILLRSRRTATGVGLGTATAAAVLGHASIGLVQSGFAAFTDATTFVALAARVLWACLAPVQLLLLDAALRTRRALPAAPTRTRRFGVGVAAGFAWVVLCAVMPGVLTGAFARERSMRAAESTAEAALARLTACAAAAAAKTPARGFPSTLAALGPDGSGCLDATTAAGTAGGYRLRYLPEVADARGVVAGFVACAEPVDTRVSSVFTYVVDAAGDVARGVPGTIDAIEAGTPLPCPAAWSSDGRPERGVEHCLLAWADAHPDVGYPVTLAAAGDALAACLATLDVRRRGVSELTGAVGPLIYRPSAPGPDGVRRTFALTPLVPP